MDPNPSAAPSPRSPSSGPAAVPSSDARSYPLQAHAKPAPAASPSTSSHPPSATSAYYAQYPPKIVTRPANPPPDVSPMQAHIHSLPVELLSRIFLIGWQEDPEPDDIPTSQVTFEALVSHVCHLWRDVAVRNPVFWSIIHFRTIPHIRRAREYLQRNKANLFDVYVDTCAEDEHKEGFTIFRDDFIPVFNIVQPYIRRWRSLHLKVRDLDCKAAARTVLSSCGGAPYLETLHLWHIENWGTPERLYTAIGPPPVVVFNQELPMLKNIILTGVNLPWTHSHFLRNLTTVQFALHSDDVRMPYDLWSIMLVESPHLEKLSLHYSGPRFGSGDWPTERIPLPGLREVDLTNMEPTYLLALLRRLHAPNVRQLRLELELPDQDFTPFVDFLVEADEDEDGEHDGIVRTGDALSGAGSHANRAANMAPPPADDERPSQGRGRRRLRGPMFPALDSLSVCALESSAESWRRLLQSCRRITCFEADFGRMTDGLFKELLIVDGESVVSSAGPSRLRQHILLPSLHTLRLSGLTSSQIRTYITFRHAHFPSSPLVCSPNPPMASPIRWMLEQSQCDDALDTWFADEGLYVGVEEKEVKGWEDKERVEWFKGEEEEGTESDLELVEGDDLAEGEEEEEEEEEEDQGD